MNCCTACSVDDGGCLACLPYGVQKRHLWHGCTMHTRMLDLAQSAPRQLDRQPFQASVAAAGAAAGTSFWTVQLSPENQGTDSWPTSMGAPAEGVPQVLSNIDLQAAAQRVQAQVGVARQGMPAL